MRIDGQQVPTIVGELDNGDIGRSAGKSDVQALCMKEYTEGLLNGMVNERATVE